MTEANAGPKFLNIFEKKELSYSTKLSCKVNSQR